MPHRIAHRVLQSAAAWALMAGAAVAADGLQTTADGTEPAWPTWQMRVNVGLGRTADGGMTTLRQAALLGDYYLHRHGGDVGRPAWQGGFRATSGLLIGRLGLSMSGRTGSASLTTVRDDSGEVEREVWPYIGFGYSGLAPRGGWGFSADLGIALRQPAAAPELGRALLGLRGWESALRGFDPLPMVQLGVRYSF